MNEALFELGGLRFWSENELELREAFQARAVGVVKRTLTDMNPAWRFARCEGPILHPRSRISTEYTDKDIFVTNDIRGGEPICLRSETTASSYAYARFLQNQGWKLPLCVWQAGISARRELNDGASAANLRFNCFWQLEFQCIYKDTMNADYRSKLMSVLSKEIERFTSGATMIFESERLPSYSESTIDINIISNYTKDMEVASCSIRNDYGEGMKVCEIAIGLDRVATLAAG